MSDNGDRPVRGTGKLIKQLNRSRILECFLNGEPLSRVEVAERTGISLPAVSHLVAEMEAQDLVVRVGKGESSGGRRPVLYAYNSRLAYVVGLDLGGTKLAGGVSDLDGNLLATGRVPTHAANACAQQLHMRVRDFILELIHAAGVDLSKVMGIGIGVPGIPDPTGKHIRLAPGLQGRTNAAAESGSDVRAFESGSRTVVVSRLVPGLEDDGGSGAQAPTASEQAANHSTNHSTDHASNHASNHSPDYASNHSPNHAPDQSSGNLAVYLEAELGRPVYIDNDVNMIVQGERWKGALQGVRHGVCVTVGTGVGVGLLTNGEVYRGAHGAAGEIGYWLIGALGPVARTEGYGPLETFAAGPGIARRCRARLEASPTASRLVLDLAGGDVDAITARIVAQAASAGDPLALEVWRETVDVLGVALANLCSLIDPEAIVIGGGVSGAPATLFSQPLQNIIETLAPYPPRVASSQLGERAGILGAVATVINSQRNSISYLNAEVTA